MLSVTKTDDSVLNINDESITEHFKKKRERFFLCNDILDVSYCVCAMIFSIVFIIVIIYFIN